MHKWSHLMPGYRCFRIISLKCGFAFAREIIGLAQHMQFPLIVRMAFNAIRIFSLGLSLVFFWGGGENFGLGFFFSFSFYFFSFSFFMHVYLARSV